MVRKRTVEALRVAYMCTCRYKHACGAVQGKALGRLLFLASGGNWNMLKSDSCVCHT